MAGCCGGHSNFEGMSDSYKRILWWVIAINAVMFFVEMTVGVFADSTALIADSLDMLADAIVYGIGIYAVGKSLLHKANAAQISGYFQLMLGVIILIDITRRLFLGSEPVSSLMIGMGFIALIANVACLVIIRNHKNDEVHMRASWIFSANDVIANMGVIIAGILVVWLDSRIPDLVIGFIVSIVVLRGASLILKDAKQELLTNALPKNNAGSNL